MGQGRPISLPTGRKSCRQFSAQEQELCQKPARPMYLTGFSPPGASTNKYSSSVTQSTLDGLADIKRAMAAPAAVVYQMSGAQSAHESEEDRDAIALHALRENRIAKELAIQRSELEQIKIQKEALESKTASAQGSRRSQAPSEEGAASLDRNLGSECMYPTAEPQKRWPDGRSYISNWSQPAPSNIPCQANHQMPTHQEGKPPQLGTDGRIHVDRDFLGNPLKAEFEN